ncbi:MAG: vitamin K epoxide reductase family protein [Anaerolineae bacterium]|nr:vitamin K epoxide reductase family protein [Anaerolineae bacterium]
MSGRAAQQAIKVPLAVTRDAWRLASIVLAVLGVLAASYLSYVKLSGGSAAMACPAEGQTLLGLPIDCGLVDRSLYSMIGPMPVAVLGLGGYVVILLALLLEDRVPFLVEYGRLLLFGLTLFGFAFSLYLTWAEIAQIQAFCIWCVASAVLMTLLFILSVIRLRQSLAS